MKALESILSASTGRKLLVEKRSAAIRKAVERTLPVGTTHQWVEHYRRARENERWLIENRPQHIVASQVAERFELWSSEETGQGEPWIECLECHDVLHTYPTKSIQCSCGTVMITYRRPPRITITADRATSVRLIPRGRP